MSDWKLRMNTDLLSQQLLVDLLSIVEEHVEITTCVLREVSSHTRSMRDDPASSKRVAELNRLELRLSKKLRKCVESIQEVYSNGTWIEK